MQEINLNKLRTVVSEESFFVSNPVLLVYVYTSILLIYVYSSILLIYVYTSILLIYVYTSILLIYVYTSILLIYVYTSILLIYVYTSILYCRCQVPHLSLTSSVRIYPFSLDLNIKQSIKELTSSSKHLDILTFLTTLTTQYTADPLDYG